MFTGLVEDTGRIVAVQSTASGRRIVIEAKSVPAELKVGDSVAADGVCLTAVRIVGNRFELDLALETLKRTTLAQKAIGALVNLELPLRVGDRMGGHFVQGHVDTTGRVRYGRASAEGRELAVSYPVRYDSLVVEKGSIAINGVSLTVARQSSGHLRVALIPHTCVVTNLGALRVGQKVNLEFDYLAKLVASSMTHERDAS